MVRVYVASAWRNTQYPAVCAALREIGCRVYDWRAPGRAFAWDDIDPGWRDWSSAEYIAALRTPAAQEGFARDMRAMARADLCVLLLPSGRSAHLEAGWMAGRGKGLIILHPDGEEPELMAGMANSVVSTLPQLIVAVEEWSNV